MTVIFGLILSSYCVLVLVLLWGWFRMQGMKIDGSGKHKAGISVVIACRNEQENVNNLIRSLSAVHYPVENFEVIIVDDHSTDDTVKQLDSSLRQFPNFSLIHQEENFFGKKQALQKGISKSKFDIIVTTDADCQIPQDWLSYISLYFELQELKMLIGGVKLENDHSLFSRLQAMEFSSLMGFTAAAVGLGRAILGNGANLAFRKAVFNEVGGYDDNIHIASGDDEFLIHKISKRCTNGIAFINYSESLVSSKPSHTIREFFNQRIRWAGKWKVNTNIGSKLLAVSIVVAQVAWLALLADSFFNPQPAVVFIIMKLTIEAIYIFSVTRFLGVRFDLIAFLLLQLIYPIYVIAIGFISLWGSFQWKDRNYKMKKS